MHWRPLSEEDERRVHAAALRMATASQHSYAEVRHLIDGLMAPPLGPLFTAAQAQRAAPLATAEAVADHAMQLAQAWGARCWPRQRRNGGS